MKHVPEKALFLSTNNNILNSTQMLNYIYQNYKEGDNFLYITYSFENTYG